MAASKAYSRRYVSGKESMAYVLFDSAKSFHINEFGTLFVTDVLKIDLRWNSIISLVNGIWDVVNDSFLGVLVDKTKTRWGKFKPYLFLYATLGTVFLSLFWMMPLFFDKNPTNVPKAVFWLLLNMLLEVFGTLRGFSETGLISCISPNPDDRVRLYTVAEVVSSIWENIPGVLMAVLVDLAAHGIGKLSMDSVYTSMGVFTVATGGALSLLFCFYAKERITQSREKFNYREGLRVILHNKPLLILLISDFFGGFSSAETWERYYYRDVLGALTLRDLVRLPGGPLSFLSYTYLSKARGRYPIKWLWIFGQHAKDVCSLVIFAVGSLGGIYGKVVPMVAMLMVRNLIYMGSLSIVKIIPREIMLDALEYAEWNTGMRAEGTIQATKGMVAKVVGNIVRAMTTMILQAFGYNMNAAFGKQSQRTKYALFGMAIGIPGAAGMLSMIPKLFYDLTGEKRQRMYEELAQLRKIRQAQYDVIAGDTAEAERSAS